MIVVVIVLLLFLIGGGAAYYFAVYKKEEDNKEEPEPIDVDIVPNNPDTGSTSTGSSDIVLKRIIIISPAISSLTINDISMFNVDGDSILPLAHIKATNMIGQNSEMEVVNCDNQSIYCPAKLLDNDKSTAYKSMANKQMKITVDLETNADGSSAMPPKYSDIIKLVINVNKDQTKNPTVTLITGEQGQSTGDSEVDITNKVFRDKLNKVKLDSTTTILTKGNDSHATYKVPPTDGQCPLNATHNLTYLLKDYSVVTSSVTRTDGLYYVPLVAPTTTPQYVDYMICNPSYAEILNELYLYTNPTEYISNISYIVDSAKGTSTEPEAKLRVHTIVESKSKDIIKGSVTTSPITYLGHHYASSTPQAITSADRNSAAKIALNADEFIISFNEYTKMSFNGYTNITFIFYIEFTIGNYKTGVTRTQNICNPIITKPSDIIGLTKKVYKKDGYAVKNIVYLSSQYPTESIAAVFFKPEQFNSEYKVPTVVALTT